MPPISELPRRIPRCPFSKNGSCSSDCSNWFADWMTAELPPTISVN